MKVSSKLLAGGSAADIPDASGLFGFTVNDSADFVFFGLTVPLQYFTLLSIVYYMSRNNRWNSVNLFHLLFISHRKEVKYEPFYPYY